MHEDERRPLRVVVADDDAELRGLMAEALAGMGCEVWQADDGTELMSLLIKRAFVAPEEASVDLVIVDINMPGCSGLQVLADLHGRRWRPTIAVVTGNTDPDVHVQARQLGAVAVLHKPIGTGDLRRLLAEHGGDARAPRAVIPDLALAAV